ncbi:hypothetical protein ACLHDF_30665 [Priestia aryabhattai]|uniref:hypothetical protein n=1 Tax=Priestia megaterium TaxID=1404 RepID=UPI0039B96D01
MFSKWFKQSPKIETVRKIHPSSLPTKKKVSPIDQRSNQKRRELPKKMKPQKQSNLKKLPQQPKELPSQIESNLKKAPQQPKKLPSQIESNLKKLPQQPKELPSQIESKTSAEAEFTKPAFSSDSALNLQEILDQVTRLTDAIPKIEELYQQLHESAHLIQSLSQLHEQTAHLLSAMQSAPNFKDIQNQLSALKELSSNTALYEMLTSLDKKINEVTQPKQSIVVEKIMVEKVLLDKIDLSNNFGQLGIKDLTGHLNIGTTYSTDSDQVNEEVKDLFSVKLKEKKIDEHTTETTMSSGSETEKSDHSEE